MLSALRHALRFPGETESNLQLFRIQGQVYHKLGPLLTSEDRKFPSLFKYGSMILLISTQVRLNTVKLNSPGPAIEIIHLLENEVV